MRKTTKNVMLGLLGFDFVAGASMGAFAVEPMYSYAEENAMETVKNLAMDAKNWTNAEAFTAYV